jgi:hypothetical protein
MALKKDGNDIKSAWVYGINYHCIPCFNHAKQDKRLVKDHSFYGLSFFFPLFFYPIFIYLFLKYFLRGGLTPKHQMATPLRQRTRRKWTN